MSRALHAFMPDLIATEFASAPIAARAFPVPNTPGSDAESAESFVVGVQHLAAYLRAQGYRFITVTPATHQRVLEREPERVGTSMRDIFGWNLPFRPDALPTELLRELQQAKLVQWLDDEDSRRPLPIGPLLKSCVRFASIGNRLYVHDAFPTLAADAVFFGPDTYRFVAATKARLRPCRLLVDVCCGSGVGGLEVAERAAQVVLADISPKALLFAQANCRLAGNDSALRHCSDLLTGQTTRPDAIIANPPYLADPLKRAYRDGGGDRGIGLSLRIVQSALRMLAPGGQLLLYTGTPIVDGIDLFACSAVPMAKSAGAKVDYTELDPDVFGEELSGPAYHDADRIAAVLFAMTAAP